MGFSSAVASATATRRFATPDKPPIYEVDMSSATAILNSDAPSVRDDVRERAIADLIAELRNWFEADFSLWNSQTGQLLHDSESGQTGNVELLESAICSMAANRADPRVLAETDHVLLLALPLERVKSERWVAVAPFVTSAYEPGFELGITQRLLDLDSSAAVRWIESQKVWDADMLLRLAAAVFGKLTLEVEANRLEDEIRQVSQKLSSTYEEISLLYGVTQNLRLTSTDEQLGRLALEWLSECLPATGLIIQFLPVDQPRSNAERGPTEGKLLTKGECPLNYRQLSQLVNRIQPSVECWPFMADLSTTSLPNWRFPGVRQLILAPLYEGENIHGWIAALNHVQDEAFDMMAASLLTSVGAILGIHSGNHHLCRQQSEFMANVVRALTSAIDAKDPYTCGHSDRVARISVRLARELGCDDDVLNTIYMAGLLHDIGKIGIDDGVLRKADRLSDAEYEHIKLHPELGYKILKDFTQFEDVLPVVLHHHEHWDGRGYPFHLAGEDIPHMARICAVADAYDAMTSDRPYRKGMPHRKVEQIFRSGAGSQWDPEIVDAFFAAKGDIRKIVRRERAHLALDVQQWT